MQKPTGRPTSISDWKPAFHEYGGVTMQRFAEHLSYPDSH
jgi:hypothetical protein